MSKLRIIVGGFIGLYPTGGAAWDYLQYPLGLKMLGHDVFYIEDTLQYPIFQTDKDAWDDASATVKYLQDIMEQFGFQDRWAYRDIASGKTFGMSDKRILELCNTADIFINISCSTYLRDEYLQIPKRILIDTDPMFTQIQYALDLVGNDEWNKWNTKRLIENHNYLFSFGENIGADDCRIPSFGFNWRSTRQPVCLDQWFNKAVNSGKSYTSIMNWSERKPMDYDKQQWGQKNIEFKKIMEVPVALQDKSFEIVINHQQKTESMAEMRQIENAGWKILNPHKTVATLEDYRSFIEHSKGELSVAKETYVKSNSGWFSCRSACYLASGRPVITQETGWSKFIPVGKGLFAFNGKESAIDSIMAVESDLKGHSIAAVEIAREYFDSRKVLNDMIESLNEV